MSQSERAEQKLVEKLSPTFFPIAAQDATLAIAMDALCDSIKVGDFADAMKLMEPINQRLELLHMRNTVTATHHKAE